MGVICIDSDGKFIIEFVVELDVDVNIFCFLLYNFDINVEVVDGIGEMCMVK